MIEHTGIIEADEIDGKRLCIDTDGWVGKMR